MIEFLVVAAVGFTVLLFVGLVVSIVLAAVFCFGLILFLLPILPFLLLGWLLWRLFFSRRHVYARP